MNLKSNILFLGSILLILLGTIFYFLLNMNDVKFIDDSDEINGVIAFIHKDNRGVIDIKLNNGLMFSSDIYSKKSSLFLSELDSINKPIGFRYILLYSFDTIHKKYVFNEKLYYLRIGYCNYSGIEWDSLTGRREL